MHHDAREMAALSSGKIGGFGIGGDMDDRK